MNEEHPVRLPMVPGDICVHAHANGAVVLVDADHRWSLVTLADAVAAAAAAGDRDSRVFLLREDDSEMAMSTIAAVVATGARTVDYSTVVAPFTWPNGGSALMVAALEGRLDLLDDLIERGADVNRRDDAGATALHHAAVGGDLDCVRRLLGAGVDRTVQDLSGRTAAAVARFHGHMEVGAALGDAATDRGPVRFGRGSARPLVTTLGPLVAVPALGALAAWPVDGVDIAVIGLLLAACVLRVMARGPLLTGGVPVGVDGSLLTLRRWWGTRIEVDLSRTAAAELVLSRSAGAGLSVDHTLVLVGEMVGSPTNRRSLGRLVHDETMVEELGGSGPRTCPVVVSQRVVDQVLETVGPVLSAGGVALGPGLRSAVARPLGVRRPTDAGEATTVVRRSWFVMGLYACVVGALAAITAAASWVVLENWWGPVIATASVSAWALSRLPNLGALVITEVGLSRRVFGRTIAAVRFDELTSVRRGSRYGVGAPRTIVLESRPFVGEQIVVDLEPWSYRPSPRSWMPALAAEFLAKRPGRSIALDRPTATGLARYVDIVVSDPSASPD
ncbi:MAG: ankyrin repeat domain-containing protein [Acidimicrobiales bacterium]